jgi:Fumarylacetoacetate (FAA) hydrolase family
MTLLPGDIISTGTPAGVALGMATPVYLRAGDLVELGIEKLGESRQAVIEYDAPEVKMNGEMPTTSYAGTVLSAAPAAIVSDRSRNVP